MTEAAPTTYMQSMQEAKGHGRAFLQSTIGRNPGATAVLLGVLVLVTLILGYYLAHYKAKCGKSGFHIAPISNLTTGGNNPLWWHGSMDAGNWGPVHREATAWNVAAYNPGWRTGRHRMAEEGHAYGKEHMTAGMADYAGAAASPCGPGETAVSYQNPDGSMMTYCRSTDALPGPPTACGAGWDPAASAEAQALATVGSYPHETFGERRLQRAVNGAYDSNVGLSDDQLTALMHQGGTP